MNFKEHNKLENYKVFFGNKQFKLCLKHNPNSKKENEVKVFFDESWRKSNIQQIEATSLLLNKYIPIIFKEINKNLEFQEISLKGNIKKLFLEKVNNQVKSQNIIKDFCNKFKERIKNQKEALNEIGYRDIFNDKLKTAYRLVVGLGSGSFFETSLTLHHIFGIPYIPATALKGVVRAVSFWEITKKQNVEDSISEFQKKLYDQDISNSDNEEIIVHKILFGSQNFKGLLLFLDAYPDVNDLDIFELDVMTPHYQKYYTENQTPGDWENPNPITFLTIKKGISFQFNILLDKYRLQEIQKNRELYKDQLLNNKIQDIINKLLKNNYAELREKVKNWIELALKEFGVGAKTRLGYGIFE